MVRCEDVVCARELERLVRVHALLDTCRPEAERFGDAHEYFVELALIPWQLRDGGCASINEGNALTPIIEYPESNSDLCVGSRVDHKSHMVDASVATDPEDDIAEAITKHSQQIREWLDRCLIWKPRFDQGKPDLALRALLVRRAENYLKREDPTCRLKLAKIVEGILESAWQQDNTYVHSKTRTRPILKDLIEASEYAVVPKPGWIASKLEHTRVGRAIRREWAYRRARFSS